jgi:hypothetical protein
MDHAVRTWLKRAQMMRLTTEERHQLFEVLRRVCSLLIQEVKDHVADET